MCFAMARSRSPDFPDALARRRLRLAGSLTLAAFPDALASPPAAARTAMFSVAGDGQRGSLTLVSIFGSLASPPAQLTKPRTPPVAGSLVPRLTRDLTPYPAVN
jgi:hypothetical protein